MNDLDNKILKLFIYLINSKADYLRSITGNCFNYIINGVHVSLYYDPIIAPDFKSNSHTTLTEVSPTFKISCQPYQRYGQFGLRINDKFYIVPQLSRTELASTLDTLDNLIREKEESDIETVIATLKE